MTNLNELNYSQATMDQKSLYKVFVQIGPGRFSHRNRNYCDFFSDLKIQSSFQKIKIRDDFDSHGWSLAKILI